MKVVVVIALALMMVGCCFAGNKKLDLVVGEDEKWSSRHLVGNQQEVNKHQDNDNCCDHHSIPRGGYGGGGVGDNNEGGKV
ncbi:hypothetical protein MANES_04G017700v8 [Manihot esculenta]|uniref:Glycine-rich protein n=2 Tax=Manihot esculenta TaxID=3983 RepID=A0A251L010_MANES|nr:hypothetical protein MANES_04G017700v8 [Manihot esculenta]OAY51579.1 hypothetical protein MANES_04G017700v8 [Manihot esculenta]OAY51580.1 hypothetical protein MANES_04G017700v8 [Manihot esculenta]